MNIGFMACLEPRYFPGFQSFPFESERSLLDFDLVLWHLEFLHFGYQLDATDMCQELERLLRDRKRRLEEVERLLEQRRNLVILLSDSVPIIVKSFWERLRDYANVEAEYWQSRPWEEGTKERLQYITNLFTKEDEEVQRILKENRLDGDTFDVYSFLPGYIESPVRKHAVPAKQRSNEVDFRGDSAFMGFWESIRGVAWYDMFFSSVIGTPLLYKAGTQYPVAAWLKHSNGNIFLIPNTRYDDSDDYPTFVEAAQMLVAAVDRLAGDQVECQWVAAKEKPRQVETKDQPCYADSSRTARPHSLGETLKHLQRVFALMDVIRVNSAILPAESFGDLQIADHIGKPYHAVGEIRQQLEALAHLYAQQPHQIEFEDALVAADNMQQSLENLIETIRDHHPRWRVFLFFPLLRWEARYSSGCKDVEDKARTLQREIQAVVDGLADYVLTLMPVSLSERTAEQITYQQIKENPQSAVQYAFTLFEECLRERTGVGPELYGEKLINNAFADGGCLTYGELRAEQLGVRNLMSGAYATLRGPRIHRLIKDDEQRAFTIIALVDLLMQVVDEAEERID